MVAFVIQARVTGAPRIYQIIFVVVAFSVIVQGAAVPGLARRMGVPLRIIEPEPWSQGIGSRGSLRGLHPFTVAPAATADGTMISGPPLPGGAWVSFILRNRKPVPAPARCCGQAMRSSSSPAGQMRPARPQRSPNPGPGDRESPGRAGREDLGSWSAAGTGVQKRDAASGVATYRACAGLHSRGDLAAGQICVIPRDRRFVLPGLKERRCCGQPGGKTCRARCGRSPRLC